MSKFIRPDFNIKRLADNSFRAIDEGAYECKHASAHDPLSIKKAILSCPHAPLIAEVKFASPSQGQIRGRSGPAELATAMTEWGAVGLSVLTQPYVFEGSIEYLAAIRKAVTVPLLMKDIIVSRVQIDAARKTGADCVLLIKTVFDRDLAEESIENLAEYAAKKSLSVIIEVHTDGEFAQVLKSKQDLIGINNRNLDNLQIDISNTERLLSTHGKGRSIIISESGIATPEDIRYLRRAGADAFLVGTSIMETADIGVKVRELCDAI
ncbi:MAG: indole-3-glycerol phosphate synthase TrpC [Nitrososphaera sp.]